MKYEITETKLTGADDAEISILVDTKKSPYYAALIMLSVGYEVDDNFNVIIEDWNLLDIKFIEKEIRYSDVIKSLSKLEDSKLAEEIDSAIQSQRPSLFPTLAMSLKPE